jgi:Raf kinase inhibitor-like YbhB/YbcL family protein
MVHQPFTLSSPAFQEGERIPDLYTCRGRGVSPPLRINGTPDKATSLALILHDPDAPQKDFLHWSIWGISPITIDIDEDIPPVDATEGTNDFGDIGYGAPCPPTGTHRYEFDLYALDGLPSLHLGASRQQVENAIRSRTIARTTLTGMVSALI